MSMPKYIKINHYRGDTFYPKIKIKNYVPSSSDVIKFGVKVTKEDSDYIILKTIDPSDMRLRLESSDTQNLDGDVYCYDIQVTFTTESGNTITKTVIYGDFKLRKDVVR